MRDRLLAALCSTLTLSAPALTRAAPPAAAAAQQPPEADTADEGAQQGSETEGQAVEQSTGDQVKTAPEGNGPEAPGQAHTVVKGDTLWDLSQKYLGSPWYWPKVWSYNPQIANPHWIYPGNVVRFANEGEEVPSKVEVGNGEDNGAPGALAAEPLAEEGEDVVPSSVLEAEDNAVHVSGKLTYVPKAGIAYTQTGFVTREEVQDSGVIQGAFSEALMLSTGDLAYVDFRHRSEVHVGDRYLVFRKERRIDHPITHQPVGYLTRLVGVVRVEGPSNHAKLVRTRVVETWGEMVRGDLIGPFGEHVHSFVEPRRNDRSLKAVLVSALLEKQAILGEQAIVVVDKGRTDGVQAGNTFTFLRQGDPSRTLIDPAKAQDSAYPVEDVGTCVALEVKAHASTCMVTRSLSELVPGDRAEMRAQDVKVGVMTR